MAINVHRVFLGCRAAAREMLGRGELDCILSTALVSSEYVQLGHTMYDASKGAAMMLTRVTALELSRFDVRVNIIAPGIVETTFGISNPELNRSVGDSFLLDNEDLPKTDDRKTGTEVPVGQLGPPGPRGVVICSWRPTAPST